MTREILSSKNYGEFKERLTASDCSLCALSKGRTRLVVDRGSPKARVLFIGEAPGEKEDLAGKAFVGRSGRLLDEMLKAEGFDTDQDSLIANIVKCRPPKNRAPRPLEAETCLPFLRKQIELVKPIWIGLLGATALKRLFPGKKELAMSEEAGRFFTDPLYPGIRFMALFHPAYILRDPRKKPLMARHLKGLVDAWKQN